MGCAVQDVDRLRIHIEALEDLSESDGARLFIDDTVEDDGNVAADPLQDLGDMAGQLILLELSIDGVDEGG